MFDTQRVLSVDVGGTFTDALRVASDGTVSVHKFSNVRLQDFRRFVEEVGDSETTFLYSTTALLNALLSGDLMSLGLIVNKGFRDLLETARLPASVGVESGNQLPRRLVPLEYVRELDARIDHKGQEIKAVCAEEISALINEFKNLEVTSIVVSLLHSYAYPEHEQNVRNLVKQMAPHFDVTLSSMVLSESREYERTLSAVLTSLLRPIMRAHLEFFTHHESDVSSNLWLMQSNGGVTPADSAIEAPLPSTLSGPVAAVVGMAWLGQHAGFNNLITLDVGGTSTDVALITDGVLRHNSTTEIGGFSLQMPSVDVLSIGAGGGSIAFVAPDKRWHVGPESAGASPGPACYGLGGVRPTLTDANLVLGRIPSFLLGGTLSLVASAAFKALSELGQTRKLDALQTAKDILRLSSHSMCGAIRRVSVLRGYDPIDYALCAMGGAGPMHAVEIAELLGVKSVFVPPDPGVAAAWGVYIADIVQEFSSAIGLLEKEICLKKIAQGFENLIVRANSWANDNSVNFNSCSLVHKLDLRYEGMTHESTVECGISNTAEQLVENALNSFHSQFEESTGRVWRDKEPVEVVNLRISLVATRPKALPNLPLYQPDDATPVKGTRRVGFLASEELIESIVYNRKSLSIGTTVKGPAVIEQADTTTILPPKWEALVDMHGNLLITEV